MGDRRFETFKIGDDSFEIRVSKDSMFSCRAFDKHFENESVLKLKADIKAAYDEREKTDWAPMIEIGIEDKGYSFYRSTSGFKVDIKLFGNITSPSGETKQVIAHIPPEIRDLLEKGENVTDFKPFHPYHTYNPNSTDTKYIPYTPQKFKALSVIQSRMDELKAKIQALLASNDCEKFLESVTIKTLPQIEFKSKEVKHVTEDNDP